MMYVNYNRVTSWTKEQILYCLETDDRWVERALVMLFNRQTEIEQRVNETFDDNDRGLQRADVWKFSAFAKRIIAGGHLTHEELSYCRRPWCRGRVPVVTIGKYRGQILDMIESAARRKLQEARA
jgi:hypothetical protein